MPDDTKMPDDTNQPDKVEEALLESFPASDPPSWTPVRRTGKAPAAPVEEPAEQSTKAPKD